MPLFAYDDPIWDTANHAYGVGANVLLSELEKNRATKRLTTYFSQRCCIKGPPILLAI